MVSGEINCTPPAPGDCILFATADWDEPYWTNKQHCAKELTRLGWRVLYVESLGLRAPKVGSKKDIKRLWLRLKKGLAGLFLGADNRAERLWVLSPLVIPGAHHRKWVGKFNQFLIECALKKHIKAHNFKKSLVWTYHPFMLQAMKKLDHGALLYHCVDDLSVLPGVDKYSFEKTERELLRSSDVVFATTNSLAEKCLYTNPHTYFLPNVVNFEHFSQNIEADNIPNDLVRIPEPRLVYHGVLSDFKLDLKLLYDAAKITPQWQWVFIGEEREGQNSFLIASLQTLPNVYFLGYKNYNDLPKYLCRMSIGLLPTLINSYTNCMFPMKYYEYVASGLRVVSTPLEFTKNIRSDALEVAGNVVEFIDAIQAQLEGGRLTRDDSRGIIGQNTWHLRTITMLNKLKIG